MASEIISTEMVVALTGVMGAAGAGVKFAWNTIAKRVRDSELRLEAERVRHELKIENERLRYESVIADQIRDMRREMSQQDREISHLRRMSDAYMRHIVVLEQLMRQAGIEIPILELPEYPSSDGDA
ncbi:hypothetical protein [Aurantimonas coralicida]|uniref:hypothetical protein n=1 Tax=Aurantimonas coralicida TaxID=182270 RepID=UPI00239C4442|nr:hypothetical protein [Aurantimonas coralicida]MDE0924928.1 hypothetical protein [Aurantimonas coralicida]